MGQWWEDFPWNNLLQGFKALTNLIKYLALTNIPARTLEYMIRIEEGIIYKKMTLCLASIQMWWVPTVLVARPSGYLAAHNHPHNKFGTSLE